MNHVFAPGDKVTVISGEFSGETGTVVDSTLAGALVELVGNPGFRPYISYARLRHVSLKPVVFLSVPQPTGSVRYQIEWLAQPTPEVGMILEFTIKKKMATRFLTEKKWLRVVALEMIREDDQWAPLLRVEPLMQPISLEVLE